MRAIEFITKVKEGRGKTIEIPKEYADEVSGEFRVILLLNTQAATNKTSKRTFKALKVKTKGFKFARAEIYDE